ANQAGRIAALTMSDSFCIERHRADFRQWLGSGQIGLLFANVAETKSLYETDDFDAACRAIADAAPTVVVTMGGAGARIIDKGAVVDVPAEPAEVVDLTGAGDLFAGGYMLGHARGLPAAVCGKLGALAAAEVIGHVGARPQHSLKALADQAGIAL
ncbi:MAG: PfkB family carbohydrate kinase, partial [Pseudomonadota bacterium]